MSPYHVIMYTTLGTNFVSHDTVKVWYLKFKNKDYDIQEKESSGHRTDVDEACTQWLVEEDQYATTWKLAKELDVSDMSTYHVMLRINLTYKFNCWVPHELTQADKDRCVWASINLLKYQCKDKILDQIVTCDEKWNYFNKTSRKWGLSVPSETACSVAKWNLTNKKTVPGGIDEILPTNST